MTHRHVYLTTTIPYVNARPHVGFALELVQADVLARHHRRRGDQVRFQASTDDNALKNVQAAERAGVPVQEFVDRNAEAFVALHRPLSLSVDDVVHTSRDPRHRIGVERFWRACEAAGDLYRKYYEGLYCVGCEQFYTPADLDDGRCPEHGTTPQRVAEENWFFRLSRYAGRLHDLVESGRLRIEPAERRNEVLSFIAGGLEDFSVSRSVARARGWGIPVPGDPGQVVYVWWDALGNYLTALGYGTDNADLRRWWSAADRRIHLVGKGVLRFHAVYWPAMLLSAGQPLPTEILVHGYLTADGSKISKSGGNTVDPTALVDAYGTDALRWWLLREVPRVGDADFTHDRLIARADDELANGIGNLVNRVIAMLHRYRDGRPAVHPGDRSGDEVAEACERAPVLVDAALDSFDFRAATGAVRAIADAANRFVNRVRPWELASAERAGDRDAARDLDAALAVSLSACRTLGEQLSPFLPDAADRIVRQCTAVDGRVPAPSPVFPRLARP
ncbi:methionine--tRNA ligase [Actinoallomurus sp. NPDC050550]|uniref:methionine--tRNA ligase n=1 Tax=Actinoallomurus sp. NPDC050550 TaxID=3154937 RepID=UPI0033C54DCE